MITPGSVVATRSGVEVDGVDPAAVTFRPIPSSLAPLLTGRVLAITLGRVVWVHPDALDAVISGDEPELVAHELIHVGQWSDAGALAFLVGYLADYARLRMLGCGHHIAYRHIRYEWAAYSGATHIVRRP